MQIAYGLLFLAISSTIEAMLKRLIGGVGIFLFLAYLAIFTPSIAHAEISKSSNYSLDETAIGTDSQNQASSTSYQSDNSATGALVVGNASSAGYQIEAGTKTTADPALSFFVSNADANFGSFTAASATVTTATFSVSNYTSYGYVVQIFGDPPTNGTHTIKTMSSTSSSIPGTEQFGINLVANTLPTSVGANPNNGSFGFGSVDSNYNTPNKYRYISGETIALAPKSSGVTTYTISYLVNVDSITVGGKYTSNQTIVITGTY